MEKPISVPPSSPADGVPDELVLAAIERAERHRARDHPGVPFTAAVEHLGLPPRAWTTRRLRPQFEALEKIGVLERSRRHGLVMWRLTRRGRQRLSKARRARWLPPLPESPQHTAWREAHANAGERVGELRNGLRSALNDTVAALDTERRTDSDTWFELGERLQRACWRIGSATHCLHEWAEPTDDRADVDYRRAPADRNLSPAERAARHGRRAGRRNTKLWDDRV
jgi:hypothetical protein